MSSYITIMENVLTPELESEITQSAIMFGMSYGVTLMDSWAKYVSNNLTPAQHSSETHWIKCRKTRIKIGVIYSEIY